MTATLTLYAVRNREGKWFRAKGYGGYGDTWTPDIGKAKLYSKIAQARGRVTFFATSWPEHGTPDLVEFTATESRVMPEAERVKKVAASKAELAAAREVRQRKEEIALAVRDKEAAERRLAQLRAER